MKSVDLEDIHLESESVKTGNVQLVVTMHTAGKGSVMCVQFTTSSKRILVWCAQIWFKDTLLK